MFEERSYEPGISLRQNWCTEKLKENFLRQVLDYIYIKLKTENGSRKL